jgi:AraC-like DNA-binding protein
MPYRELPQQSPLVACLWQRDAAPEAREVPVLPDACVDVVWIDGHELLVAGPSTGPVTSAVPAGATVLGVRFRVGAAGAALGVPARELIDATVPLENVWGREAAHIAERIASVPAATRLTSLTQEVWTRLRTAPDSLVRAAATSPEARIDRLAANLGIGERQLRRRFAAAVGYGPKTLQRILRFQRFLALARRDERRVDGRAPSLARLAVETGYADQAHLTRECRRLAGRTPAELLASGAGPAGDRSVSFKTPAPHAATLAA